MEVSGRALENNNAGILRNLLDGNTGIDGSLLIGVGVYGRCPGDSGDTGIGGNTDDTGFHNLLGIGSLGLAVVGLDDNGVNLLTMAFSIREFTLSSEACPSKTFTDISSYLSASSITAFASHAAKESACARAIVRDLKGTVVFSLSIGENRKGCQTNDKNQKQNFLHTIHTPYIMA